MRNKPFMDTSLPRPGLVTTAILLCLAVSVPMAAEMRNSGERIEVSVETLATSASGSTVSTGSTRTTLGVGESRLTTISCGSFASSDRAGSLLVMGGVSSKPDAGGELSDGVPDEHPVVWRLRCRLIGWETDRIDLELTWIRFRLRPGQEPAAEARGCRLVTLPEDGYHVLDSLCVPAGQPESTDLVNRLVVVRARVIEAPALAGKPVRYDLWLVDDAGAGERLSRPLRLHGSQGEALDFHFEPVRWPLSGVTDTDGRGAEAVLELSGTLRGRCRQDGTITLSVETTRKLGVGPEGEDPQGWSIGTGTMSFCNPLGKPVSMVLPPAVGQSILAGGQSTASLPAGVERVSNGVKILFAEFLDGHTVSLIITPGSEE